MAKSNLCEDGPKGTDSREKNSDLITPKTPKRRSYRSGRKQKEGESNWPLDPKLPLEELPPLLTDLQVASTGIATIWKLRRDREQCRGLPFFKFGKSVRYRRDDLIALIAANLRQFDDASSNGSA